MGSFGINMEELTLSTKFEEKDYEKMLIIDLKCFSNIPEILAFFPGGIDPAHREANVKGFKIGVFGGSTRAGAKIFDPKSGDIAAFISCRVHKGPKGILDDTESPVETKLPRIENPEDREFYEWYWTTLRQKMRQVIEFQVPHVYIQVICTDPVWQRHGAASKLMEWYLELARKEGIGRCALCASPFAAEIGFYEKFGFIRTSVLTFVDEDRFPGRVGTPEIVMVKDL